jgi:hypothetical protein
MGASPHSADDQHERSASVVLRHAGDDELYAAALAALLDQVAHPPSLLDRIWRTLRTFHARRRDDGEPLPPEHWFWMT